MEKWQISGGAGKVELNVGCLIPGSKEAVKD